ncbi:uncharacterized protein C16orf86-like isoform X1 [Scyliorhinus canicula]|uniref:uncharacterized protein C16orf86-like isoform X1 n=2 Tax=Scyliorhinus canicula TaxID=7830 RepID=UPI0018F5B803|nr:uncharacterized protein C16orf86-like isoform X1 [Scyliorhinus canicula]
MSSSDSKSESNPRKVPVSRFFAKLSALMERPEVRALHWDEKGKAVIVNAKVYEEEMKLYGELLPELKNYQSMSMLHSLLCTYGFKKKMAKASAELHIFQHPDFTKEHSYKDIECDSSKTDLSTVALQQKKALKKKRRNDGVVVLNSTTISPKTSTTTLESSNKILSTGKQRRMLYQYINFDNPEFNVLTTTENDQKEQTIQENISENKTKVPVPSHPTAQTAGNENKEDSLLRTSPSLSLGTPEKSAPNKSAQVSLDINKMLSICAAPLVPPLSPQPKC